MPDAEACHPLEEGERRPKERGAIARVHGHRERNGGRALRHLAEQPGRGHPGCDAGLLAAGGNGGVE